jgi:hypothetical protein
VTVRELIEKLQAMPPDANVMFADTYDFEPVRSAYVVEPNDSMPTGRVVFSREQEGADD